MRLFHLSDLHLGRTLFGRELLEDQRHALSRVVARLERDRPELLLIAGDVYDRAIPPVDAIRLFDAFLLEARAACPGLEVVVIPGNHDSAGRLSFASGLLAASGLKIAGTASADPVLVLGKEGRRVGVWAFPFLGAASAPWDEWEEAARAGASAGSSGVEDGGAEPGEPRAARSRLRSQDEYMRLALEAAAGARAGVDAAVLVAHCFAAGASPGDSETAYVGMAERVDTRVFDGFDYVALGHLHGCQSPAPGVWYSGAPLPYSVADAGSERGFLSVELSGGDAAPEVEFVPIEPLRRIRTISGLFDDLMANPLPEDRRGDYIHVRLTDESPILDAKTRFSELYPFILDVRQAAFEALAGEGDSPEGPAGAVRDSAGGLDLARRDFMAFHELIRGEPPSADMLELFSLIAKEAADASDQAGA